MTIGAIVLVALVVINKYPWILGLTISIGGLVLTLYLFDRNKKNKFKAYDISYLDRMDPFNFEEYVCKLYKELGYKDSYCRPKSGDFGADVIAQSKNEKITVQVKVQYTICTRCQLSLERTDLTLTI